MSVYLYSSVGIYTAEMDDLVLEVSEEIGNVNQSGSGLLTPYFLVRYRQEHHELRVRIASTGREAKSVIKAVRDRWKHLTGGKSAVVPSSKMVRYRSEKARYGGSHSVRLCETLFFESTLQAVRRLKGRPNPNKKAALAMLDAVSIVLALTPKAHEIASFLQKHAIGAAIDRHGLMAARTSPRYGLAVKSAHSLLSEHLITIGNPERTSAFSTALQSLATSLRRLERSKCRAKCASLKYASGDHLISGVLHMHFNRLGIDRQSEAYLTQILGDAFALTLGKS